MIKKRLIFIVLLLISFLVSTTVVLAQSFQSNCSVVIVGNPQDQQPSLPASCTLGNGTGYGPNISGKVPLYKQWDEKWHDYPFDSATVSSNGCGPTSLAMVISYWTGREILPPEIANKVGQMGFDSGGHGMSGEANIVIPTKYGLNSKQISWNEAKKYLAQGMPIIQRQHCCYFTSGGHYVVVTGTSGSNYLINDPDGKHRTTATEAEILGVSPEGLQESWVINK